LAVRLNTRLNQPKKPRRAWWSVIGFRKVAHSAGVSVSARKAD
jgi:hypothetical protein